MAPLTFDQVGQILAAALALEVFKKPALPTDAYEYCTLRMTLRKELEEHKETFKKLVPVGPLDVTDEVRELAPYFAEIKRVCENRAKYLGFIERAKAAMDAAPEFAF